MNSNEQNCSLIDLLHSLVRDQYASSILIYYCGTSDSLQVNFLAEVT